MSLVKQNADAKGREMTSYDDDAYAIGNYSYFGDHLA